MGEHTPGPWTVDGAEIVDPDGTVIATVYQPQPDEGRAQFLNPIEEPHPHARLIAAAPELLKALESAFQTWYQKPGNIEKIEPAWVVMAREAIEKAKSP